MPLPSSLSRKRMENYGQSRIIDVSTNTQSATNTLFPLFPTCSLIFGEHPYSQNLTCDGGITMCVSRKATNTKQPSKHAMAYSNPRSCFSASVTPLPHFRQ